MDFDLKEYKRRLIGFRERKNLSQRQLAHIVGITQPAITHHESMSNKNVPRIDTIIKFAKVFNISVNALLGLEKSGNLKDQEYSLLSQFKELDEKEKYIVLGVINSIIELKKNVN